MEASKIVETTPVLSMCADVDTIVADMIQGHDHMNRHGIFYDQHGACVTIGEGTNCGLYWMVQCERCGRNCSCGAEAQFAAIRRVPGSKQDAFLRVLVRRACERGYVYLMRRNADSQKQYRRDVR